MRESEKISRKEALGYISKSSIYGNLGLFIGAGMSMAILNDHWPKVALSWKELIFKCAEEFDIDLKKDINTEGLSYPEIATEIAKKIAILKSTNYKEAVKQLKRKIAELTSWYPEKNKRPVYGQLIEDLCPNWIITTNYDLIIECLLTGKCLSLGPDDQLVSPRNLIPIYHLHGIRTNPDSIIISQEDYISLFRPNQYRQQKLALSIKESTTLIIGYGLGDVNVLTAVDWTKNVFKAAKSNYPHDIIQLLYTEQPVDYAYRDRNDILIVEFNNLIVLLGEIVDLITIDKDEEKILNASLNRINKVFQNPSETDVAKFIDDEEFRTLVIDSISKNDVKLISGFLELFSKSIDETWIRSVPYMAFYAYNENLTLLLDVIVNIKLSKIPPALLESIAYNLDRVSNYVGPLIGQSSEAHETWKERKDTIPLDTLNELKNIAKIRGYSRLPSLFNR